MEYSTLSFYSELPHLYSWWQDPPSSMDILSKMSSLLHLIHSIYYWLVASQTCCFSPYLLEMIHFELKRLFFRPLMKTSKNETHTHITSLWSSKLGPQAKTLELEAQLKHGPADTLPEKIPFLWNAFMQIGNTPSNQVIFRMRADDFRECISSCYHLTGFQRDPKEWSMWRNSWHLQKTKY